MPDEKSGQALERRTPDGIANLSATLARRALDDISGMSTLRQNDILVTNAPNVLVVDDEDVMVKLLCELFSEQGFRPDFAYNGKGAVEKTATNKYQLITLNVVMPGMDGLTALPLIRANLPETTIIMISGNFYPEIVAEAKRLGADAYLSKPLKTDELSEIIRRVMNKQHT